MPAILVTTLNYANAIRTRTGLVGPTGAKLDLSFVSDNEEIVSITIVPKREDTIEIRGKDGDDWIPVGCGLGLEIDFESRYDNYIPSVRSRTGATQEYYLFVTVRVHSH